MRRACCLVVFTFCLFLLPTLLSADTAGPTYTPEQIKATSTEQFLEWILNPEPGYEKFAAMQALGQKAKQATTAEREKMMPLVVGTMMDEQRAISQRFQCCYVISISGDEKAVPNLIDVLNKDKSETMRSVAVEALADFKNSVAAYNALWYALRNEKSPKVLEVINKRLSEGDRAYTEDQISKTSAETFLERIFKTESGYHKFSALNALGQKAKDSDAATRKTILDMVVKAMIDEKRDELRRWQCCYVISISQDERYVPDLIGVLEKDKSEIARAVAAEALADFRKSTAAHNALLNAARNNPSPRVKEVLIRRLGAEMPGTP